jgi:predicted SAM-dependent methyltransferase
MKLDIGCGATVREGFTGIDAFVSGPHIINASMWELPCATGSIEGVYSSHALEHLPKLSVVPTLKEWLRVLQPGGWVEIQVPDLEYCVTEWLKHKTNDWWMDIIFGNQEHPGEFHQTGFTPAIMIRYLTEAGFRHIETSSIWSHEQNTLVFKAKKQPADA